MREGRSNRELSNLIKILGHVGIYNGYDRLGGEVNFVAKRGHNSLSYRRYVLACVCVCVYVHSCTVYRCTHLRY